MSKRKSIQIGNAALTNLPPRPPRDGGVGMGLNHVAVDIADDRWHMEIAYALQCFSRVWPILGKITRHDDHIRCLSSKISEYGLKGSEIPMNVREHSNRKSIRRWFSRHESTSRTNTTNRNVIDQRISLPYTI